MLNAYFFFVISSNIMVHNLSFDKMHGLGNDFVMISLAHLKDTFKEEINIHEMVLFISDRHLGAGCDQLIIYDFDVIDDSIQIRMKIFNPDGTDANACGNGTRCLIALCYQKLLSETKINAVTVDVFGKMDNNCKLSAFVRTLYGIIENDTVFVNMGQASFDKPWMPSKEVLSEVLSMYNIDSSKCVCVDVGNPHLVIFDNCTSQDMDLLGEKLAHANHNGRRVFEDSVNINFAKVNHVRQQDSVQNEIDLLVWERGIGFTLACGSGACATSAAATRMHFVSNASLESNNTIKVNFKLGALLLNIMENNDVIMGGPTSYVYTGTILLSKK